MVTLRVSDVFPLHDYSQIIVKTIIKVIRISYVLSIQYQAKISLTWIIPLKRPLRELTKESTGDINKSYCDYHKYRSDVSESEESCLQQPAEETTTLAPPQPPASSLSHSCGVLYTRRASFTLWTTTNYLSCQLCHVRPTDTIIRPADLVQRRNYKDTSI